MLYSSKREIHSMAQDPEREQREHDKEHDSDHSSCCADDTEVSKPDPLEGLDEETKICFQVIRDGVDDICSKTKCDVLISVFFSMQITHDALNAPLPILRAMYELQMKRTDSFFLEVQKRSAETFNFLLLHCCNGDTVQPHAASRSSVVPFLCYFQI